MSSHPPSAAPDAAPGNLTGPATRRPTPPRRAGVGRRRRRPCAAAERKSLCPVRRQRGRQRWRRPLRRRAKRARGARDSSARALAAPRREGTFRARADRTAYVAQPVVGPRGSWPYAALKQGTVAARPRPAQRPAIGRACFTRRARRARRPRCWPFATCSTRRGPRCVYVNVEGAQAAREDVELAMRTGARRNGGPGARRVGRRAPGGPVAGRVGALRPAQHVARGAGAVGLGGEEAAGAAGRRVRRPGGGAEAGGGRRRAWTAGPKRGIWRCSTAARGRSGDEKVFRFDRRAESGAEIRVWGM